MRFRKKPVEIEAIQFQWEGVMTEELAEFVGQNEKWDAGDVYNYLEISTLEGTMRASQGDWIIKGVQGEFYPCKPDIFEQTYEKVE